MAVCSVTVELPKYPIRVTLHHADGTTTDLGDFHEVHFHDDVNDPERAAILSRVKYKRRILRLTAETKL